MANGHAFPKQGTTEYEAVRSQVVNLLVQQAEEQERAASDGITITDQQISSRLTAIKQQYFGGSQKKYLAQLKKQQLTEAQVRQITKLQLLQTALENKATADIKVSNSDVHTYYQQHAQQYSKADRATCATSSSSHRRPRGRCTASSRTAPARRGACSRRSTPSTRPRS